MQVLKIGDEEINAGMIETIDFSARSVPDTNDASWKRLGAGERVEPNDLRYVSIPCARIVVVGRSKPIVIDNPARIQKLQEFWASRKVFEV